MKHFQLISLYLCIFDKVWGKVACLDCTNTVKAAKLTVTKMLLLIKLPFPQCNACYPGEIFFCFSVDKVLSSISSAKCWGNYN